MVYNGAGNVTSGIHRGWNLGNFIFIDTTKTKKNWPLNNDTITDITI